MNKVKKTARKRFIRQTINAVKLAGRTPMPNGGGPAAKRSKWHTFALTCVSEPVYTTMTQAVFRGRVLAQRLGLV